MAIEILHRGTDPSSVPYEGTCSRCGTKVRFLRSDAKSVHTGDQRDGPFAQVDCPVCDANVTINGYPVRR